MSKLLVVASQKGGVGKTTLSLNLAFSLAKRGWRVLLVDSDPQSGIGHALCQDVKKVAGLAEFMDGGSLEDTLLKTKVATLDLMLVGKVALPDTNLFWDNLYSRKVFEKLKDEAAESYDLIVLDTAPGFGRGTLAALRAGHYLISPVQAEPGAARSLPQILEVVAWLKESGQPIDIVGFVLSMAQVRNSDSFDVIQDLWDELPDHLVFETIIPRHPIFLSAGSQGVPVGLLTDSPSSQLLVFEQLAIELEPKIKLKKEGRNESVSLFT